MTHSKHVHPTGSILVAVLVCLTIVSSLALGSVATTIRNHREIKLHHQLRQTELLVESGFERAQLKIDADPRYNGESWQPILPAFEGKIEVLIKREQSRCFIQAIVHPEHGQVTQRSDSFQLGKKQENSNE